MKKFFIIALTVVVLSLGCAVFFLWEQGIIGACSSPITSTSWKKSMEEGRRDKSGIKISLVTGKGDKKLLMGVLEENKMSRSQSHHTGSEVYQVLAGEAILHNGAIKDGTLFWYKDLNIKEGDAFEIDPKVIYQFDVTGDHPLIFSLYAPDSHFSSDRQFHEDYDPKKSTCRE